MFKFKKNQGVEEGEYYDSSEEEYNENYQAVGLCRNDFGHIGPDKADLRFEYHYGEDGKEGDIVGVREDFRNYGRPPFFLPETPQQEFYSKTLTGLRVAKRQIKILIKNTRSAFSHQGTRCSHQTSDCQRLQHTK